MYESYKTQDFFSTSKTNRLEIHCTYIHQLIYTWKYKDNLGTH